LIAQEEVATPEVAEAVQASSAFFLVSLMVVEAQVLVPKKSTQHSQVYSFLQEVIVKAAMATTANERANFFIIVFLLIG
jgi:hypothetical protein